MYIRWQSGKREAIRTEAPETIASNPSLWVLARVALPAISVLAEPYAFRMAGFEVGSSLPADQGKPSDFST